MEVLGKTNPTQEELEYVESVINGGKTDHKERSENICAYLEMEGKEQLVYDKLCELSDFMATR